MKKVEDEMLTDVNKSNISETGVYIPKNMSLTVRPYFAIDNSDFQRSSKDGIGELHGTLIVIFQNNPEPIEIHIHFGEEREDQDEYGRGESANGNSNLKEVFSYKIQVCYPPKKPGIRV